MSLVGTRPILPDELEQYELHHRARIAIKPGITGMWQVSGRSDITDFEEIVRLDTEYISEWNIKGITDRAGELLPSVHFHGVMGEEKKELIARTSVGVANPSGRTETFGISAIDFSSRGVPVVTIASGGFLDTVENEKTGLLY